METQKIKPRSDAEVLKGNDFILPLGKYKGKTLKEVWDENPKYIHWIIAETNLDNIKQQIYKTSFYLI